MCNIPSGCGFFMGPWTGAWLWGQCVLTAAAAGITYGVVAVLAQPSSWREFPKPLEIGNFRTGSAYGGGGGGQAQGECAVFECHGLHWAPL